MKLTKLGSIEPFINKALEELMPILINYAKTNHRYQDQTGNLTMSTMADLIGNSLKLYNAASYAPYVAEGHGTWSGDDWLVRTMEDNQQLIKETIERHINEGMSQWH